MRDLFEDIRGAIDNDENEYFLGSIVLMKKNGDRPEVVDGQQRLATTAILLAAIRDYFFEHGDTDRAQEIESAYLLRRDLRTLDLIPRLKLNDIDNDYFVKSVLARPAATDRDISPSRDSHKRLRKAAGLAAQHVRDLATSGDANDVLVSWVSYLGAYA